MSNIPSLYEWMGGMPALERLTETFYERVPADEILAPVVSRMSPEHPKHVAEFLAEVFGGPKKYSGERCGHAGMMRNHLGRCLSHAQRKRWIALLLTCRDQIDVTDDPDVR